MELQKLIDGLKAHKYGAASYESVDEAIRVFEAMRDVDEEKVCKGLECCIESNGSNCPKECPYNADCFPGISVSDIYVHLMEDAIAMIRQQQERIKELEAAQTARVMTLEEVHDMAWDYCYLEEEVIKDNVLQKYCGKHRVKCITWPSVASCVLTYGDDAYGKRWRCWTQRPTDEQRKAVKWE